MRVGGIQMFRFSVLEADPLAVGDAIPSSGAGDSKIGAQSMHDRLIRALDFAIALVAIIFLAPVMLLIGAAIWSSGVGPVVFKQQRVGHGGRLFPCYKFRSMRVDADEVLAALLANDPVIRAEWLRDHKLRNDPRVSKLGGLLRRTSLDELPQFFNVLKGHMSIVGPRPITMQESARYGRYFSAYTAVRPGITGIWQITGRSQTTYRRRVACDILYARRRSFGKNLAIIIMTVPMVMLTSGAY